MKLQQELKDLKDNIEHTGALLDEEEEMLKKKIIHTASTKEYDEIKRNILEQKKKLKAAISQKARNLINEIEGINNPVKVKIQDKLLNIQRTKAEVAEQKKRLNDALQSHEGEQIFKTHNSVNQKLPEIKINTEEFELAKLKFIKSQNCEDITFGEVKKMPTLILKKTYETEKNMVKKIINNDNNDVLTTTRDEKLLKSKIDENGFTQVEELSIVVIDMVMISNGDVIIFTGKSELNVLTQDGQVIPFKKFSNENTLGLVVNRCDQIHVGLQKNRHEEHSESCCLKQVKANRTHI